jgi:hypothetical protein
LVLIARTRTESVIDRSSPYNIIETSTDMDVDDDECLKSIDDNDEVIMQEQENDIELKNQENSLSPSSSLTSGTDVYMDAVEILNDEKSGRKFPVLFVFEILKFYLDGSLTPICYGSFTKETIDGFGTNLHRIDKDVARCDRTYPYFTNINNLKKLRNIMCT